MCPTSLTAFACLMTLANAGYQNHIERITRYFTLIVRHVNEYLTKVKKPTSLSLSLSFDSLLSSLSGGQGGL